MRKTIVVAAALGILGVAAPALAAPPEIQQKSCEAGGGTFARDHGTKSCTTTSVEQFTSPPTPYIVFLGDAYRTGAEYTAVFSRTYQVQTTTTDSQKGNGEVTTTQSTSVLSSTVNEINCTEEDMLFGIVFSTSSQPVGVCEGLGLFPSA